MTDREYTKDYSKGEQLTGMSNCKSMIAHLTRPVESMSSKGFGEGKFDKAKWIKRIRGYFKSQTKQLIE